MQVAAVSAAPGHAPGPPALELYETSFGWRSWLRTLLGFGAIAAIFSAGWVVRGAIDPPPPVYCCVAIDPPATTTTTAP